MSKVVRIYETGSSEVMKFEDIHIHEPGEGEVKIEHTAIGLNFIDVYYRSGLYPIDNFPITLGMEGAGIIKSIGNNVEGFSNGDRVAYPMDMGAYSQERTINANKLVKIPDSIDDDTAAAIMLKGLTAQYLLKRTFKVKSGDNILVYAAAGGVGLILSQWAKFLGANVIGCVGSEEKSEIAKSNGCDHVILYRNENIAERVRDITNGLGVDVAYDSVGAETLQSSIDSLREFGMLVSYGNASGAIKGVNPSQLSAKGSLYFTRPTLATHISNKDLFDNGVRDLFEAVLNGHMKIKIGQIFSLNDIQQAHEDLENRSTIGSTILKP